MLIAAPPMRKAVASRLMATFFTRDTATGGA
jgi:hypothetical protein